MCFVCFMCVYRELGVELLRLVSGTETAVARLCARCAASISEINSLHQLVSDVRSVTVKILLSLLLLVLLQ